MYFAALEKINNSFGLFISFSVVLVLCVTFSSNQANADTSWMKSADTCELFKPALSAYLERVDLENFEKLPFWQREELSKVFKEACSGRFSICKLESCSRWGFIGRGKEEKSLSTITWLNRFLTCEQLLEQIESRYSSLTPDQLSQSETKSELAVVLDASCSERFSHCKFKSCDNRSNASENTLKTKTKHFSKNELKLFASKKLAKLVSDYHALRVASIKAQVQFEKENKLEWQKMANPSEAEVVAERRAESKKRKEDQQSQSSSSSQSRSYKFNRPRHSESSSSYRKNKYKRPSSGAGALPF